MDGGASHRPFGRVSTSSQPPETTTKGVCPVTSETTPVLCVLDVPGWMLMSLLHLAQSSQPTCLLCPPAPPAGPRLGTEGSVYVCSGIEVGHPELPSRPVLSSAPSALAVYRSFFRFKRTCEGHRTAFAEKAGWRDLPHPN